ncbi:cytochrome P450 [Hypomontagnella monticulosa]|nr:cytochrome P450 [Hypomontagnella monticulosa]
MQHILSLSIFLGVCLLTARLLHAYLRLSKIPGPFSARITDLWRFRAQNSRGYSAKLLSLHKKYGKLVRIGPNHVSISDPEAVPIVYSTNPVWVKAPSYYGAVTVSQGRTVPSIIAMNEMQHTAVRKSVGRAFTTNSLLDYEDSIETAALELVEVLAKLQAADIGMWLQFFAMDVLIRVSFSESLEFMQKGSDVDGILGAVMARFDHWGRWAAMPGADYILNKSPMAARFKRGGDSPLARVGLAKLQARKMSLDQLERQDLCQKFLEGQAKYPEAVSQDEILGIIMSTIGAGADTTAGTLTYTLFLLARNPTAKEKLQRELEDALRAGSLSKLPKWTEANKLPYLEAVLKESMRILPIAAWGLDRVVPAEGVTIAGKFIPGGTIVGCQIDAIQQNPDVYGDDSSEFRPERWIECSEEQKRRMDRAFLAFSAGKRICTGRHIAWLEMKKTLPLLLINFDFNLINPDQQVEEEIRISAVKYPPPIWMRINKRQAVDMKIQG